MSQSTRRLLDLEFQPHEIGSRTPSAAMLAWFLQHVERLDLELVPMAICDGAGDKGIDALVVNDDLREITLFQGKRMRSPNKTQGDQDLKNLLGAARYFENEHTVQGLLDSKPNEELRRLLVRNEVKDKVANGYKVRRAVFVTNAVLDPSGESLAHAMTSHVPELDVWHADRLRAVVDRVTRSALRAETVVLRAASAPLLDSLDGQSRLAVALISASQLVELPGVDDLTLFSRNVRLFAGNTRINKELAETVEDESQHLLFPASHNGITILTLGLAARGRKLTLDGLSVVNGCQSLLTLRKKQDVLTPDLKLLVKIVELPDVNSPLSDQITYRANNQNAVNIRDQRSTDPIQLDLQRQVASAYEDAFGYTIKIGEHQNAARVLDNTLAAQLIMAAYRNRPWAAVRKVRLFDQDYHFVFGRDINAHSLYLLSLLNAAVNSSRDGLKGELRSSFSSIRFTLVHLVAEILRLTTQGEKLLSDPRAFLPEMTDEVLRYLSDRAAEVVTSVNEYVKDESHRAQAEEREFDPKTVFMSASGIMPLRREILFLAKRLDARDPGYLFELGGRSGEGSAS